MVNVLFRTKKDPSVELTTMGAVFVRELNKLNLDVEIHKGAYRGPVDFVVYVGYDYSILSHFFESISNESAFHIFFCPAGEGPQERINELLKFCVDYMDCDSEVYSRYTSAWSYKEIISYIQHRCSQLDAA